MVSQISNVLRVRASIWSWWWLITITGQIQIQIPFQVRCQVPFHSWFQIWIRHHVEHDFFCAFFSELFYLWFQLVFAFFFDFSTARVFSVFKPEVWEVEDSAIWLSWVLATIDNWFWEVDEVSVVVWFEVVWVSEVKFGLFIDCFFLFCSGKNSEWGIFSIKKKLFLMSLSHFFFWLSSHHRKPKSSSSGKRAISGRVSTRRIGHPQALMIPAGLSFLGNTFPGMWSSLSPKSSKIVISMMLLSLPLWDWLTHQTV